MAASRVCEKTEVALKMSLSSTSPRGANAGTRTIPLFHHSPRELPGSLTGPAAVFGSVEQVQRRCRSRKRDAVDLVATGRHLVVLEEI